MGDSSEEELSSQNPLSSKYNQLRLQSQTNDSDIPSTLVPVVYATKVKKNRP